MANIWRRMGRVDAPFGQGQARSPLWGAVTRGVDRLISVNFIRPNAPRPDFRRDGVRYVASPALCPIED
jgi:hypothetical protein